jgi:hypothetical protein
MTASGPGTSTHFLWGHWQGDGAMGERRRDRPVNLGVVSRLVRKRHLAAEEFVYLRGRTSRVARRVPRGGLAGPPSKGRRLVTQGHKFSVRMLRSFYE